MGIKCPKCHFDNPDDTVYCGKCATPLPSSKEIPVTETLETPTEELTTGSTFAGRYQIIEELGKGGMGKVYKALDTDLKEKVAIKLIKPEVAVDKKTIERFRNELKFARKIRHKNVCQMYDLNREEGTHYITMEYVHGEDLKRLIRKMGQMSAGQVISIAMQVCEGMAEAHRLGVVHRDLKPQNIMVDEEGNARIMDFGIARSVKGKGITGAGVMIGTPEYMSPEQVEGKESDQRSDIYSLGVILYEMVTGRVPFEGDTPFTIGVKQKSEVPRNPKELNSQIPDDLSRVILRCMEKDKEQRYQSAGEVRSELKNIEKGIPTAEKVIPKKKPITSKEITVTFGLKKLFIPGLIVAALLIAAVIIIWRVIPQKEAAPAISSSKYSIAVLPFEDLSPTKDHEYLCDGIAETLINSLNNIKDLWVPARASSFSFKGKDLGIHEIGQQLGVENLLEASVQVIGNKLRITPKIINVNDGSQVWSEQYDRQMEDVFAIQDEIAREIVKALKIKLLGEKEAPLVKNYTENLQAYHLYLQGRYFWNRRKAEDIKKAIDYFNQAIEKDPNHALAYVGLADCYLLLPQYGRSPTKEVLPKAKAAVSKALEIDGKLAEAHTSLAFIMTQEFDNAGAENEFKRAIELNPNYATAHHWYNILLVYQGRLDKAMTEIRRAIELDPLSLVINSCLGDIFYLQGEYDQAIHQYRKTLELDPTFAEVIIWLGKCYGQKEMFEEAIAEFKKARILFGDSPYGLGDLGNAYARSGDESNAIAILTDLEEMSNQGYALYYDMGFIYWGFGDKKKAFEYLEKAYKEKEHAISYLKVDPAWESLRLDPRFKSLLKRMNLE